MITVIDKAEAKARIAANLFAAMQARGLSQYQLARETGEDQMTVSRIVRGITEPRASTLARLAEALGMTMDDCLKPLTSVARKKSRVSA